MTHSYRLSSWFFIQLLLLFTLFLQTANSEPQTSAQHQVTKNKVINIATIDYPPLMGKNGGLMTDIVKEALQSQSYQVKFTLMPMARIAWSISEGDSEAAIGSRHWVKDNTLKKNASFNSIYFTGMHFFYRKEQFLQGIQYENLSELKRFDIGYIQSGSLLSQLNKAGLEPQLVKDLVTNCRKLETQRIDMFVATELGGWGAINKQYPEKIDAFAMMPKPILNFIGSGDLIIPKKSKQFIKLFNQGLKEIKQSGRYIEILESYYGKDKVPGYLINFSQHIDGVFKL